MGFGLIKKFPGAMQNAFARQHPLARIVAVLILAELALLAVLYFPTRYGPGAGVLRAYADGVIETCRTAPFTPACYDEEIPKLMDHISMEDAFEVTKLVQEHDERYRYCHVLAHKLSYREAGEDLGQWKDVITRCPATFCNNGCLHGALMRRFNAESLNDAEIEALKPEIADVCEPRGKWNPTEVERSMCYHALGHLFMYVTRADMPKSTVLCRWIGARADGRDYVQTCTEGVFMQIFQPLEPEDEALVKGLTPGKNRIAAFCEPYRNANAFSYDACRREAWPLFRAEVMTPQGIQDFCAYTADPGAQRTCYSAVLNMVAIHFLIEKKDFSGAGEYCRALASDERRSQCPANMATRLIQIDPRYIPDAIRVCEGALDAGFGKECFRDLTRYALVSFHIGSPEFVNYCRQFPEPHRRQCLDAVKSS